MYIWQGLYSLQLYMYMYNQSNILWSNKSVFFLKNVFLKKCIQYNVHVPKVLKFLKAIV